MQETLKQSFDSFILQIVLFAIDHFTRNVQYVSMRFRMISKSRPLSPRSKLSGLEVFSKGFQVSRRHNFFFDNGSQSPSLVVLIDEIRVSMYKMCKTRFNLCLLVLKFCLLGSRGVKTKFIKENFTRAFDEDLSHYPTSNSPLPW